MLYKLFKNMDCSDLADKFGVGELTAHEIVVETTTAIVKCLGHKIHFLKTEEEVRVVSEFRRITKTRLHNVAGAIDCSHFEITRPPTEDGAEYFDHKQRYSVIMQAVYDEKKRFLSVYASWLGSVPDMRVFRNSISPKQARQQRAPSSTSGACL